MGLVLEGLFVGDQTKTLDKLIHYKISTSHIKLEGRNPIDFTYMIDDLSLTFKIDVSSEQGPGYTKFNVRSCQQVPQQLLKKFKTDLLKLRLSIDEEDPVFDLVLK